VTLRLPAPVNRNAASGQSPDRAQTQGNLARQS